VTQLDIWIEEKYLKEPTKILSVGRGQSSLNRDTFRLDKQSFLQYHALLPACKALSRVLLKLRYATSTAFPLPVWMAVPSDHGIELVQHDLFKPLLVGFLITF